MGCTSSRSSTVSHGSGTDAAPSFAQVGKVDDFAPGTMTEVDVAAPGVSNGHNEPSDESSQPARALLVRTAEGDFHAMGARCTHFGAPLKNGVLCGERVLCPYHLACFDAKSGDIEDGPALDPVQSFDVQVRDGAVYVHVPREEDGKPVSYRRHLQLDLGQDGDEQEQQEQQEDERVFVLVGGGPSAQVAAETLRVQGFRGRVVLVSKEKHRPYSRIALSKNPAATIKDDGADELALRSQEFMQQAKVEMMLGHRAVALSTENKVVTLEPVDGGDAVELGYDKVLLATGSRSRVLKCDGDDLHGIHYVREFEDAQPIALKVEESTAQQVVIVGGGFIGMEMAKWLTSQKVEDVTVVSRSGPPMANVFGEEVGKMAQQQHEAKGVKFVTGSGLSHFEPQEGDDKTVGAVVLTDGTRLPTSGLVIVGAGAVLNTEWVSDPNVQIGERGSVVVDEFLQAAPDVFAAGDIAEFPYYLSGKRARIEHWSVAEQHGRIAAKNMLGQRCPNRSVPFFWTAQYGSIRYCGHAHGFDEIILDGSPTEDQKFVAYYISNGDVSAVASFGRDPQVAAASELLRLGNMPSVAELREGSIDLTQRLNP